MPSNQLFTGLLVGSFSVVLGLTTYAFLLRRRSSCRGLTPRISSLRAKTPDEGKAEEEWRRRAEHQGVGKGLTWLGEREMRVLEALIDALLPGFAVETAADADAVIEESVAAFAGKIFRGKRNSTSLPLAVEAYTRAVARRCLKMQGRPASDIGVAGLLAEAFEANISPEQRSGLRSILLVLSSSLGALVFTGRAVPIPTQDLASRHSLLKWWSISRVGKLREAFQGIKRLASTLYFSAHPERVSTECPVTTAAAAAIKTNPNWEDIRYEPQHNRIARDGLLAEAADEPLLGQRLGAEGKSTPAAGEATGAVFSSTRASSAHSSLSTSASAAGPSSPRVSSLAEGFGGGSGGQATTSSDETSGIASTDPPPSKLIVDVVVIGSGAGGGCAAGVLASKGLKVAVLEKGGLYDKEDFKAFSEIEAYQKLYERQGVLTSADSSVMILAGSCVGGGTTVNWTASFRTPRHVRHEWAQKMNLKSFEPSGPFDKALDAVCERLEVNTEYSHRAPGCPAPASLRINQHQTSLWNGAVASGRTPRAIPRNAKGCVDCGSCPHGCAFGNKRSTHITWLQDGLDSGNLTLIPNAKVDRVLMDAGRATGVIATVTTIGVGGDGDKVTPLEVQARAVVVSGGAIHTPAILLRSGLKHPMIGRHLRLHPVLMVGGVFPEDYYREGRGNTVPQNNSAFAGTLSSAAATTTGKQVSDVASVTSKVTSKAEAELGQPGIGPRVSEFGRGVMMGVYVQDLMALDGGYGCVIEAPPAHPGLSGLAMPWNDGLSHRLLVAMHREMSAFICIGRDRSSAENRITLDSRGEPVINYKLGVDDGGVIVKGRSEMLRLLRSAGASMVVPAHEGAPWFCPQVGEEADKDFEEYVETMEALGAPANEAGIVSAHQMGSCRLSATREDGPLRETGEAWECDGLFVADASTFPTSLGINPMITVEAVAYMIAEQVAKRLCEEAGGASNQTLSHSGKASVSAVSHETAAVGTKILSYGDPLEPDAGIRDRDCSSSTRVSSGDASKTPRKDDYGVDLTW